MAKAKQAWAKEDPENNKKRQNIVRNFLFFNFTKNDRIWYALCVGFRVEGVGCKV